MQSVINLKDKVWDIFDATEYEINFFEKSYTQKVPFYIPPETPREDREYVKLYLRADAQLRFYKREEYDLLSYFGDLGGLLDLVMLSGWLLSTLFVSRLLQASLVKSAYRI